jgi:hypothetical protein
LTLFIPVAARDPADWNAMGPDARKHWLTPVLSLLSDPLFLLEDNGYRQTTGEAEPPERRDHRA